MGMEASEFGRCGAVCSLGTWVKTLTTCCRRPSPPPLSLRLSSVKWAITPRAHPSGTEYPLPSVRLQLRPCATLLLSAPGLGPAHVTSEGLCFPTCQRACQLRAWCVGAAPASRGARASPGPRRCCWPSAGPLLQDTQVWGPHGHQAGSGGEDPGPHCADGLPQPRVLLPCLSISTVWDFHTFGGLLLEQLRCCLWARLC